MLKDSWEGHWQSELVQEQRQLERIEGTQLSNIIPWQIDALLRED